MARAWTKRNPDGKSMDKEKGLGESHSYVDFAFSIISRQLQVVCSVRELVKSMGDVHGSLNNARAKIFYPIRVSYWASHAWETQISRSSQVLIIMRSCSKADPAKVAPYGFVRNVVGQFEAFESLDHNHTCFPGYHASSEQYTIHSWNNKWCGVFIGVEQHEEQKMKMAILI
jgi:membrane-associated PAP2 superfamily phosphatase